MHGSTYCSIAEILRPMIGKNCALIGRGINPFSMGTAASTRLFDYTESAAFLYSLSIFQYEGKRTSYRIVSAP